MIPVTAKFGKETAQISEMYVGHLQLLPIMDKLSLRVPTVRERIRIGAIPEDLLSRMVSTFDTVPKIA